MPILIGSYRFFISLLHKGGLPAMSSNVGLNTPRGSGTSGYVQRNQSYLRPRDPIIPTDTQSQKHRPRQPDQEILKHDRLREIEVKVFGLQVQLEDDNVDEGEIEIQTAALRKQLTDDITVSQSCVRDLKPHQVHELAQAKIAESEKLRKALGIRQDYEEGSHWRRQQEHSMAAKDHPVDN